MRKILKSIGLAVVAAAFAVAVTSSIPACAQEPQMGDIVVVSEKHYYKVVVYNTTKVGKGVQTDSYGKYCLFPNDGIAEVRGSVGEEVLLLYHGPTNYSRGECVSSVLTFVPLKKYTGWKRDAEKKLLVEQEEKRLFPAQAERR